MICSGTAARLALTLSSNSEEDENGRIYNASLEECDLDALVQVGQVFTMLQPQSGGRKYILRAGQLDEKSYSVRFSSSKEGFYEEILLNETTSWLIEPYFKAITDASGDICRYERQKGYYLLIHEKLKLCLTVKENTDKESILFLQPYKKKTRRMI